MPSHAVLRMQLATNHKRHFTCHCHLEFRMACWFLISTSTNPNSKGRSNHQQGMSQWSTSAWPSRSLRLFPIHVKVAIVSMAPLEGLDQLVCSATSQFQLRSKGVVWIMCLVWHHADKSETRHVLGLRQLPTTAAHVNLHEPEHRLVWLFQGGVHTLKHTSYVNTLHLELKKNKTFVQCSWLLDRQRFRFGETPGLSWPWTLTLTIADLQTCRDMYVICNM